MRLDHAIENLQISVFGGLISGLSIIVYFSLSGKSIFLAVIMASTILTLLYIIVEIAIRINSKKKIKLKQTAQS